MKTATCLAMFGIALLTCTGCGSSGEPADETNPSDDASVIDAEPESGDAGPDASEDSPAEAELPDSPEADGETADAKPRVCADQHYPQSCGNAEFCTMTPACYQMGSPAGEYGRDPAAEAQVETWLDHWFDIQTHEVTRAEWQAAGLALPVGPEPGPGEPQACTDPQCPVTGITWFEALFFANQIAGKGKCYELADCVGEPGTGMTCGSVTLAKSSVYQCSGARLPTSAEWEHAARAWTETAFYTGDITPGDGGTECTAEAPLESAAWYCANAGTPAVTHPIKTKKLNPFGLFDMLGNAAEWVSDDYLAEGYGPGPVSEPGGQVSAAGAGQVRGGHAASLATGCRTAARWQLPKSARHPGVGLRVVSTIKPVR